MDRSIITLCIPSHSSHLLQPLDVGCFSPLKAAYRRLVAENARLGINHVDKPEFLSIYKQARIEALSADNIHSGFRATGLVPLDPEQVLSRLQITVRTPPPEPAPLETQWQSQTPHNPTDLEHQAALIRDLLKRRTQSPPSPTDRAVKQLLKGCEIAMHGAVLLASENTELRAANKKQKAKKQEKRSYIANGGILTVAEGVNLIQAQKESQSAVAIQGQGGTNQRAPPRCSVCYSLEHKANKCPQRQ